MKIGSIELSTPAFVYAAILAGLAVLVPAVAVSRWSAIRESWNRDTVINAAAEGGDSIEAGVAACKALIAADPSKAAPRLHLGCLLAAAKNYKEAQEAFEHVPDAAKATADEKSLALTGAACALCLDGAVGGKPAHLDDAEKLLKKAIEFKDTPDALAAMAILKSWKSERAADVDAFVSKALSSPPAPAPGLLAELYKLNGSLLARNHRAADAANAFQSAKAVNPADLQMDAAARLTLLATLNEPGMNSAARRIAIEKMMLDLEKFGKAKRDALLAIGMAWHAFNGEADYTDPNGPFEKACATFKTMLDLDKKDVLAYKNYASLLEERVAALSAELTAPVTGLKGETTHAGGGWAADTVPENATGGSGLPDKADMLRLGKIANFLREEQVVWEQLLARAEPSKEDKIDAKLRIIACGRHKALIGAATRPIRRDTSYNVILDPGDEQILKQLLPTATDLAALDESGQGNYVMGLLLIEKGDLTGARTALLESSKRGFKSAELTKLLATLDAKTKVLDSGPSPTERQFGAAPLIRATLESPLGLGALKGLKITLDGKNVPASIFGSQILYTPRESEMGGGEHVVKFSVNDASGAPIELSQFDYQIDKQPPEWKVEPASGTVKGDAVFNISVADPSGVDWASLSAGIRAKTANSPLDVVVAKNGRYSHSLPAINVRSAEAILRSPFKLVTPNPLLPGEYTLWIEVRDLAGNKLKDEKAYSVEK